MALKKFSCLSPNFTLKTKSQLNKRTQCFQVETHGSVVMKYPIYGQYNLVREGDIPAGTTSERLRNLRIGLTESSLTLVPCSSEKVSNFFSAALKQALKIVSSTEHLSLAR